MLCHCHLDHIDKALGLLKSNRYAGLTRLALNCVRLCWRKSPGNSSCWAKRENVNEIRTRSRADFFMRLIENYTTFKDIYVSLTDNKPT